MICIKLIVVTDIVEENYLANPQSQSIFLFSYMALYVKDIITVHGATIKFVHIFSIRNSQ